MVREGLSEEVMSEQEGERASGVGPVGIRGNVLGQRSWCLQRLGGGGAYCVWGVSGGQHGGGEEGGR